MTAPHPLVTAAARYGVRLSVVGGRLLADPPGRLPASLAADLRARRQEVAATLADAAPGVLGPEDEAHAMAHADAVFRLYLRARAVRARQGTGWPGALERDQAMGRARACRGQR